VVHLFFPPKQLALERFDAQCGATGEVLGVEFGAAVDGTCGESHAIGSGAAAARVRAPGPGVDRALAASGCVRTTLVLGRLGGGLLLGWHDPNLVRLLECSKVRYWHRQRGPSLTRHLVDGPETAPTQGADMHESCIKRKK
jgi:hypothetical protein